MDSLHASHWRSHNRMKFKLKFKLADSTLIEATYTWMNGGHKGRAVIDIKTYCRCLDLTLS
jgi:hypothetical protein